jgi:hypothetical protein
MVLQEAKKPRLSARLILLALTLSAAFSARAGSFVTDFDSGLPAGTAIFGDATVSTNGGFTNSGCLKLTTALNLQGGGFVITNDLDAGVPVVGFVASFKALIGGGNAADGFSFNFANDLPFSTITEEGAGSGLTVEFDTFLNTGTGDTAPSIDVKVLGGEVNTVSFPGLRTGVFVDVVIQLNPNGQLEVYYDGVPVYTNQDVSGIGQISGGHFGFGARTGLQNDNHFIDNLSITTFTNAQPFVQSFAPIGRIVRGDSPVNIVLTDSTTAVDTNTLVLKLDGATVVPTITQSAPNTTISYIPPALFASGSSHTVSLVFADNNTPTPNTNTLQYGFTVATYTTLSTNLIAPGSLVSTNPGFAIRYSQIADSGSRDTTRAESQLANLLIDNSTGLPFANLAATNPADGTFTYVETNVINYGFPAGSSGDFPNDTGMPGLPGPSTGTGSDYAMDAVAYLHLAPGFYNLGVNSSDGFRLTIADGADVFAQQEAAFTGVRAAADSTVAFSVSVDGYYPFRLVYFTGDPGYGPAPGTSLPSVEFFNIDITGTKVLVNDTNVAGYVPAFTPANTRPYVRSISPNAGDTGVPGNAVITATLVDGSVTVLTNTIQLTFNGSVVTPIISSNASVTTVTFDPPGDLTPNSTNTVKLAFTDSSSNRRTNTWQFTAANILQEIWNIAPNSVPYVTSANTERGLAYNPKTDHLILVSRAAALSGTPPLEIEILNSATGAKIGTLNKTGISGGTFILNQIDVADDGVIYASNLATDTAANNLRIYRWSNETASPVLIYSDNPANPGNLGTPLYGMRLGDVLRVRGSGAGTQILLGQNTAISTHPDIGGGTNVVLFTTIDGTNFTAKRIPIRGINNGDVRLGLAFGCGNTLYGMQTGAPLRNSSFDPVAGTGILLNTYVLNNPVSTATVGPLGVDLFNQRIIGNATSGNNVQHSMNLYDSSSFVASPTANPALDTRVFHTANVGFGTGAVDFTPDGTRVFALDTGNGVIAFNLAAKLAAPSICGQPQNDIVLRGGVGFFSVGASGAPQKYQWRFNGTNIPTATNETIDIFNVQSAICGNYTVVITNSMGSVTSSIALLDIQLLITNQPVGQVVAVGGSATFTVGADGNSPFTYQWQLNGTNIAGATSSSLTINNAQQANAGGYTVIVTDPFAQNVTSQMASLTVGTLGTGTGLNGDYYSSQLKTFAGPPTLSRIDPTVNFDFGIGSPDPSISSDTFTVRWSGQVQPLYTQTYTFYTRTDDGVRLWVNGQKLVNKWVDQGPTEWSGTIALTANQKYDVLMEYYENTQGAVAQLSWSSLGQVKQIIPQTQLYPGVAAPRPTMTVSSVNGTNVVMTWSGSYTLQSSANAEGPYVDVAGATSPYTINVTAAPQMFFRLISE